MKFAKKIEIKVTVKDNPFLKEQVPYLTRRCNFLTDDCAWDVEQAELVALIDSDEFIITLTPITNRNGELAIVNSEFQYAVELTFKGTSMTGNFRGSYEPYVLLTPSEAFRFIFPTISPKIDADIHPILSMVFGLIDKSFKYEII